MNNCNNCLKDCLRIKGLCEEAQCENYYLSQFVPFISVKYFSDMAINGQSGKELANDLLCGASMEVLSDLQRINIQGVSINKGVLSQCYDCNFSSVYKTGGGMLVQPIKTSSLTNLSIPSLQIKTNNNGPEVLQVCDSNGTVVYQTTITLVAGTVQTISIPGEWKSDNLHIKFANPNIQLASLICKKSGCNCGGKNKNKHFNFYGYDGTTKTTETCGFKPCVSSTCSSDDLICSLTASNKELIARLMAYKIAIKLFGMILMSTNWRETQMTLDKEAVEVNINTIEGKYHQLMFGSESAYGRASTNGMAQILAQSAKNIKDPCVVCNARYYKTTAVR